MKINRLVIENFKSIERIELIEPNPFTVFVGPNGSGKSNIFEGLEFLDITWTSGGTISQELFGGGDKFQDRNNEGASVKILLDLESYSFYLYNFNNKSDSPFYLIQGPFYREEGRFSPHLKSMAEEDRKRGGQILNNFNRIFVGNRNLVKLSYKGDNRLSLDADNLEAVLKRILESDLIRDEIFDWLELFVPGFKAVEVDDRYELHWFEESSQKYFTKDLISDGTYKILALLAAVYQSKGPQFLCIEEPENGLNPKVAREFVNLCRYACEEFGHHIWLNTHSQTLVSALTPDEIILVDKVNGATQTKQIQGMNLHGLPMDEAWLSNALGGGLPW